MNVRNASSQQDPFSRGIAISVIAHVLLVGLFFVKTSIFPSDLEADLPALRVDIVALPDKIQNLPAPNQPAEPEAKEVAKPTEPTPTIPPAPKQIEQVKELPPKTNPKTDPDAINLKKTKAKQAEAMKKLKAMQALENIKQDMRREQSEQARLEALAARARAGAAKVKGNVLASGTDLNGIDKLQHDEYRSALDRHIKPFWQLPDWLGRKGYRALAIVKFNAQGQLISRQILKSSGNPDFDESILDTIDRAAPLPTPPAKFASMVESDGIMIEFGGEQGATR